MSVNLYYTQKVRGFQQETVKYSPNSVVFALRRTLHQCPRYGSTAVVATPIRKRSVRGEPMGRCREVRLEFTAHRLYCRQSLVPSRGRNGYPGTENHGPDDSG